MGKEPEVAPGATFQESGRLIFTIRPLRPSMLPKHPDLPVRDGDQRGDHPDLKAFVTQVLDEALEFISVELVFFKSKGSKESAPAKGKVELFARDLNNRHASSESWFARRSTHEDKAERGTASWREFLSGIFEGHSINEKEYTPDVYDAREILSWHDEVQAAFSAPTEGAPSKWSEVSMCAYEMAHKISSPLSNRVFPELIVSAKFTPKHGKEAFLFVQIPVELETSPKAFYSNERYKKEGVGEQKKSAVVGKYVSVERCIDKGDGHVQWEMATASDASGALPVPLQKLGVPGAIVKDVGLFMGWIAGKRK